jgi:hypothetical protein
LGRFVLSGKSHRQQLRLVAYFRQGNGACRKEKG